LSGKMEKEGMFLECTNYFYLSFHSKRGWRH
jgi:hypothetical protein